jgi:predicted phage-related endonuclease
MRFWHNVKTLTPPAMDGSDASSELLGRLYPNANNKTQITLPDDALPLISQYEVASDEEKAASERKDEATNKLKALLCENEIGVAGDRIITWKNVSSERLNSKILKVEQPEIYSKYVSENSYRRFSIK